MNKAFETRKREKEALILAALLHDIGKIQQREEERYHMRHAELSDAFVTSLRNFLGDELCKKVANLVSKHHDVPSTRTEKILHIADKLAAAERYQEKREKRLKSNEAALVALPSRIELFTHSSGEKYYQPKFLEIKRGTLFPTDRDKIPRDSYTKLWKNFMEILEKLRENQYESFDFITLYFILKRLSTFVPSATPWEEEEYSRTVPDVSLFDHSRLTCAIAACLFELSENAISDDEMSELIQILRKYGSPEFEKILSSSSITDKKLFLLVRGDIAGIQRFVYSITKPEVEAKGTAKRLRGRSFYISLLTEVISDWIRNQFDLPITNELFCEGGRFDLLLPYNRLNEDKVKQLKEKIDNWLFKEFYGKLSIQIAGVPVRPKDFFNFHKIYMEAEDALIKEKQHKFSEFVKKAEFYRDTQYFGDICPVCKISSVPEGVCSQCELQSFIGSELPKCKFLINRYGAAQSSSEKKSVTFPEFGLEVLFLKDEKEVLQILGKNTQDKLFIYSLNSTEFLKPEFLELRQKGVNISMGFKFIANSVPFQEHEEKILDFENIAALSEGAKNLGVLKMDIDNLGLTFGLGIKPISASRIFTLSNLISIFFKGWINQICQDITLKWKEEKLKVSSLPDEEKSKAERLENIFYTIYSGGDDLLILGPWDQVIELAQVIYSDFREYTCNNPNITLSGGISIVKPHFPIQRFSQVVGEELEKSKHSGKDKVTIWGKPLAWVEGDKSFYNLINYAKKLEKQVKDPDNPLPKGFLYYLLRLEKLYIDTDKENIMWVPYFIYAHARRIKEEVEKELSFKSEVMKIRGNLKIPISYVSLKTRKEG